MSRDLGDGVTLTDFPFHLSNNMKQDSPTVRNHTTIYFNSNQNMGTEINMPNLHNNVQSKFCHSSIIGN